MALPLRTATSFVTVGHRYPIYRTLGWRVSGRAAGGAGSILLDRCRRPSRRAVSRELTFSHPGGKADHSIAVNGQGRAGRGSCCPARPAHRWAGRRLRHRRPSVAWNRLDNAGSRGKGCAT
jgi:hypothetical protein